MFVVDRCPFGDQPVVPGGVGCADRVYGRPYDCYLPSVNAACCLSCEEIKTDITGKYSDISKRQDSKLLMKTSSYKYILGKFSILKIVFEWLA